MICATTIVIAGYDVVKWIEEQVVTASFVPPEMRRHLRHYIGSNEDGIGDSFD